MPSWAKWGLSLLIAVALVWIGWRVPYVLVTLHIMVCFVLIIVIMLQSGNAADLAGAFGGAGSQTAFGPRGAATFLSRATTWCAIVFMMTSLTLSVKRGPSETTTSTGSILEQTQKQAPAPAKTAPGAPTQLPVVPGQAPAPAPGQAPAAPPAQNQQPAPSAPPKK
ncbi:MAG: preprotein translocase subunit SecG [Candidatus Acidiferrales bacterium]